MVRRADPTLSRAGARKDGKAVDGPHQAVPVPALSPVLRLDSRTSERHEHIAFVPTRSTASGWLAGVYTVTRVPEFLRGLRTVLLPRHVHSLSEIRRQRVFQAFSVPGAEQVQKLLSVGP